MTNSSHVVHKIGSYQNCKQTDCHTGDDLVMYFLLLHCVVRELTDTEIKNVVTMVGNETVVSTDKGDAQRFTYDYSFWSFDQSDAHYSSQTAIYQAVGRPLLSKVLEGYNACLVAYGQTGSGKSYR